MRWVAYRHGEDTLASVGILGDGVITPVRGVNSVTQLLERGPDAMRGAGEEALSSNDRPISLGEGGLLAPLATAASIRDSLSFEQHARMAAEKAGQPLNPLFLEHPLFYFSNPHAIVGPFDDVQFPPGADMFDFELEVAAVIGRPGINLSAEEAEACIAGYLILNDWSDRATQEREMPAGLGPVKSKDSVTSIGPALVTPDELADMRAADRYDLEMIVRVNGEEYGRDRLLNMRWSFGELVAFCSRRAWIRPGDVIASGTCGSGCISELAFRNGGERYPWLVIGDEVEIEVSGLGRIANRIVEGASDIPSWVAESRLSQGV